MRSGAIPRGAPVHCPLQAKLKAIQSQRLADQAAIRAQSRAAGNSLQAARANLTAAEIIQPKDRRTAAELCAQVLLAALTRTIIADARALAC